MSTRQHPRSSANSKFWFLILLSVFLCTFPHCGNSTHHNQAPVADAGQDITLVIASDQTTASVLLDGSSSSDPDGTVTGYTWTGTLDPEDAATPAV